MQAPSSSDVSAEFWLGTCLIDGWEGMDLVVGCGLHWHLDRAWLKVVLHTIQELCMYCLMCTQLSSKRWKTRLLDLQLLQLGAGHGVVPFCSIV